ncbi:c-type cytochrome [Rivibacter subsaxonicus]|uniref:Cytochrome c553 n=1 Tax=Rivibacter subsaxonicus TaxID=457575 RepID=A0A4Q7VZI9_9BURK|nr:cytochrome c [Rivibacter subsaxonicus]RZU02304.1 cytochrome c553 [Rivibacter subsaxonicus]
MARGALATTTAALALLAAGAAGAQSPAVEAGRQKAQMCAACHGPLGLGSAPDAPHLAGQPEIYLAAQLKAFRSGVRRHEQMNVMAKALSDEDIAALAAWYASLKIEVQPPR